VRVTPALVAFAACAITIVVGINLFGSTVPGGACEGVVCDASICESLRLRQSPLAAILIGSALIAASVTSGALIISSAMRGAPPPPRTRSPTECDRHFASVARVAQLTAVTAARTPRIGEACCYVLGPYVICR
jgi:hypothetical protein